MTPKITIDLPEDFEQRYETYLSADPTLLEELGRNNFLGVADVTLDIKEKLEMADKGVVWIPIIRNLVRFPELYPVHSAVQMDNYGDTRSRALKYLKDSGHIKEYEFIQDGGHRWYTKIKVTVNRLDFQEFYKSFERTYKTKNIDFPLDGSKPGSPVMSQKSSRKAHEKRWDIMQRIWETYETRGYPDRMKVEIEYLLERVPSEEEVNDIIKSFCEIGCFAKWGDKDQTHKGTKHYEFVDIDHDKLSSAFQIEGKRYMEKAEEYQKSSLKDKTSVTSTYPLEINIKDREVWISEYLLSKPHAVGSNLSFLEYALTTNGKVDRENLPASIKQEVSGKHFTKILNALGFKGEILKAFFPKRGKGSFEFRSSVSLEDITSAGINEELLFQELKIAHTKSSPK